MSRLAPLHRALRDGRGDNSLSLLMQHDQVQEPNQETKVLVSLPSLPFYQREKNKGQQKLRENSSARIPLNSDRYAKGPIKGATFLTAVGKEAEFE